MDNGNRGGGEGGVASVWWIDPTRLAGPVRWNDTHNASFLAEMSCGMPPSLHLWNTIHHHAYHRSSQNRCWMS